MNRDYVAPPEKPYSPPLPPLSGPDVPQNPGSDLQPPPQPTYATPVDRGALAWPSAALMRAWVGPGFAVIKQPPEIGAAAFGQGSAFTFPTASWPAAPWNRRNQTGQMTRPTTRRNILRNVHTLFVGASLGLLVVAATSARFLKNKDVHMIVPGGRSPAPTGEAECLCNERS